MRETIIRCNNCKEVIYHGSNTISRQDLSEFTILNGNTRLNLSFDKKMNQNHRIELKLERPASGSKTDDVCAACVIRALHNAIKNEVADRLEGGEK